MDVDAAIRSLAELWPDLPARLVGATEDDIHALSSVVRRELPRSYRVLLAHMGRDDAGLGAGFMGGEFRIETLQANGDSLARDSDVTHRPGGTRRTSSATAWSR